MLAHEWVPVDGLLLETAATETIRAMDNTLVVAGPGAGKTELLAQKASFLLETGRCPHPQKILAISFKVDAAKNLGERVGKRCGKNLANRFVSMTFDAYAKSLLDRFYRALPVEYQPQEGYKIITDFKEIIEIYKQIDRNILNIKSKSDLEKYLTLKKLPFNESPSHPIETIVKNVWQLLLKGRKGLSTGITFNMISRLSEYLIRNNPILKKCLLSTYSHLFLDEFQDTTSLQYELIKTCFLNSKINITAVGDQKQRIMLWAGADTEAFENIQNDFKAKKLRLLMNHRSAPNLVAIQRSLEQFMTGEDSGVTTSPKWQAGEGICEIWNFDDPNKEAQIIAEEISVWIKNNEVTPEDICILVRQKSREYSIKLVDALQKVGIESRDESSLQNLLTEDIVEIILDFIIIICCKSAVNESHRIFNIFKVIKGYSEFDFEKIDKIKKLEIEFITTVESFQNDIIKITSKDELTILIDNILTYIGKVNIVALFPQYKNTAFFNCQITDLIDLLWESYEKRSNWEQAVESVKGKNCIPIMTIHKSKGLEYDTIIFVGLEDSAFWNIDKQREEETCAFFVAFSRAKRQVIFTFSFERNTGRNHTTERQQRIKTDRFYTVLQGSDIVQEKWFTDI